MIAISIRQPWAWLIVNSTKRIENRTWPTNIRGPVLIHAAKGMTRAEYEEACEFMDWAGILLRGTLPRPEDIQRGGIIGKANLVDCVSAAADPWFVGPYGHVLADVEPLPFRALKGMLGYFNVDLSEIDLAGEKAPLMQPELL